MAWGERYVIIERAVLDSDGAEEHTAHRTRQTGRANGGNDGAARPGGREQRHTDRENVVDR